MDRFYSYENEACSCEEDLPLSFDLAFESIDLDNDKKSLGQVFTSFEVARFMVKLIEKSNIDIKTILDPCIGPNTFPQHIDTLIPNAKITGIEVDKAFITSDIINFYHDRGGNLINGSFFDYPITKQFDAIIQNPPYVRHELLSKGINSKEEIIKSLSALNITIPLKSNLYIYFLLKSLLHLKEGGKLVAITYDSWLYSSFGLQLKNFLLKNGQIDSIYHFKKTSFSDAIVGATIIEFTKNKLSKNTEKGINYFAFDTLKEINFNKITPQAQFSKKDFLKFKGNISSRIAFESPLFCLVDTISSYKPFRGMGTVANEFFIFDTPQYNSTIPFIKDVSKIKTLKVTEPSKHLLIIDDDTEGNLSSYLEYIEQSVKTVSKYKTLRNAILHSKDWYKLNLKPTGNIIFNYYLRKNIDFILNINELQVSDNFYVLNIKKNTMATFAILNSTFTKLSIIENSRLQGNGLRKIQLFEFNKVKIINPNKLDKTILQSLEDLGNQLCIANRFTQKKDQLINKIDCILLDVYNEFIPNSLTITDLQEDFKKNSMPE